MDGGAGGGFVFGVAVVVGFTVRSDCSPVSVSVLGCTGSVGEQVLEVLEHEPGEYRVVALTAATRVDRLIALAHRFRPSYVAIEDASLYLRLKEGVAGLGIAVGAGPASMLEAAACPADVVYIAIVGMAGLMPTAVALAQSSRVAIACKEALVCAGPLLMNLARTHGAQLLPVDSEHSALFQLWREEDRQAVASVALTASGGALRDWPVHLLEEASVEDVLCHPNWSMGPKITVDCATMANKLLELVEACVLFDLLPSQLRMVMHRQSLVHALIAYRDGSMVAQMSGPRMHLPIAAALTWPLRPEVSWAPLDVWLMGSLDFSPPDLGRYPLLACQEALLSGSLAQRIAFNAANEYYVGLFLAKRMTFGAISRGVLDALQRLEEAGLASALPVTLPEIVAYDAEVRAWLASFS
jgi:1-deoxy-D-xylulose-5-phosphate reductoisomerase